MENLNDLNKIKLKLILKEKFGFYGPIIGSTKIEEDYTIQTGATDGEIIKINPNFWNSLCSTDKEFLLAHEVMHIVLLHALRFENRDPQTWNEAADITINNILKNQNFKYENITPLFNSEYDSLDLTTEQLYNNLIKEKNKKSGNSNESSTNNNPTPNSNNSNNSKYDLTNDLVKNPKIINEPNKIKEIVTKIAAFGKNKQITSETETIINNILKPKVSWNTLLKRYLTNLSKTGRSYKRLSNRSDSFALPSKFIKNKLIDLHFYLDTSCSVTDEEINLYNSEIRYIKNYFNPKKIFISCFDTELYDQHTYTENDPFNTLKIKGRGCTDFKKVIKHIKKTKPQVAIIFTDLYVDYIPKNPKTSNIIWVNLGDRNSCWFCKPNYGQIIDIKV